MVVENSTSYDQLIERNIADGIRKEVNSVVMAVEQRVHAAILTAMDNIVIPRVKMVEISIIESSERGQIVWSKILTREISQGKYSTHDRVDLNIDQDRNDETGIGENSEDGDFPALRPNSDRQPHTHHKHVEKKIIWTCVQAFLGDQQGAFCKTCTNGSVYIETETKTSIISPSWGYPN